MCPLSYHRDGFMETPELWYRMYGYPLWGKIASWSHHSAQTASSERCIVQIVNVTEGHYPLNPRECSNRKAVREIYTTMCPPCCHHNVFMATPELGHRMYRYILHVYQCAMND